MMKMAAWTVHYVEILPTATHRRELHNSLVLFVRVLPFASTLVNDHCHIANKEPLNTLVRLRVTPTHQNSNYLRINACAF